MGTGKYAALAFSQDLIQVFDIIDMNIGFNEPGLQTPGHGKEFQQVFAKVTEHRTDLCARDMLRLKYYF
jgi:hypothetical protein